MSKVRPVKSLPMRGIEPADPEGTKPTFQWVDPTSLYIETDYQRDIVANGVGMIRRIVARWNWARVKPPVCVRVNEKLVVIDGQHTAIAAASHGGIPKLPVMIVEAKTMKDRAAAFISQNRDRLAVTTMHLHFAAAAAGDEIAVAVEEACAKAKASIVRQSRGTRGVYRVGETFAVGVITRIVKKVGVHNGAKVLKILVDAKRAPMPAEEIAAVASLLFDPEYKGKFDPFDIATAIRSKTIMGWRALASKHVSDGATRRKALAIALSRSMIRRAA